MFCESLYKCKRYTFCSLQAVFHVEESDAGGWQDAEVQRESRHAIAETLMMSQQKKSKIFLFQNILNISKFLQQDSSHNVNRERLRFYNV